MLKVLAPRCKPLKRRVSLACLPNSWQPLKRVNWVSSGCLRKHPRVNWVCRPNSLPLKTWLNLVSSVKAPNSLPVNWVCRQRSSKGSLLVRLRNWVSAQKSWRVV